MFFSLTFSVFFVSWILIFFAQKKNLRIQKEQEEAYFIQQLQQAIRNPEGFLKHYYFLPLPLLCFTHIMRKIKTGITFWKEHFSNVKIDWMQFAIPFFQSVRVFFPDPSLEQNERRIDSPYFAHQRGKSRMNLADLRKKSKEELQQDECMVACLQVFWLLFSFLS